jgi:transcriptional regulator with PAS, ATPase and Fis domain
VLLDEIGEMPNALQASGLRQDLYFRIAGLELTVPPLRERISDLGMLAEWLMIRIGNKVRASGVHCAVRAVSPAAIRVLEQHAWPGNVRGLSRTYVRAMIKKYGI